MIVFGAIWAQTPFFGLFYLKSYDDEIWYVGTLCDLEYECPNRISIFGLGPYFFGAIWAHTPFLSVCLSAPRNLRGLKSYDHEIWHVGPLSDRKPLRSIRIFIFGRGTFLWARTPFFGLFGLFKD